MKKEVKDKEKWLRRGKRGSGSQPYSYVNKAKELIQCNLKMKLMVQLTGGISIFLISAKPAATFRVE